MLNVSANTVEVCATASAVISIGVRPKVSFDGSLGMCVDQGQGVSSHVRTNRLANGFGKTFPPLSHAMTGGLAVTVNSNEADKARVACCGNRA